MDGSGEHDEPPLAQFACDPCWVTWRLDAAGQKRPVQRAKNDVIAPASTAHPRTWRRREKAERLAVDLRAGGEEAGIGIVAHQLRSDDRLVLLDLNSAINRGTGEPKDWAAAILERLPCYSETSPSGRGLHIVFLIAAADVPAIETLLRKGGRIRAGRKWFRKAEEGQKAEGIEFIWRGYATFTGCRLRAQPRAAAYVTVDTIRWLFSFADEFKATDVERRGASTLADEADQADAPAALPSETAIPSEPQAALRHQSGARRFAFLARRVHRWTISDTDAQFQARAEFASTVAHSREGRSEAWVAPSRLKRLPGCRRGSKRSSKTAYAALASLREDNEEDAVQRPKEDAFTVLTPAVPPGRKHST